MRVKCTASTDCPWVNELRLQEEHLKTCRYVLIFCANGCGYCTVRDKLLYHCTEVCPLRQYTCVHCKGVGTYKDMIGFHLDVCPDAMVACPNRGCGESVKRKDIASHCSECPDATIPCPNGGCGASVKRKDLASHSSECQYETISCTYMNIGCTFRSQRPEMADHIASSSKHHLDLAMIQLTKQGEEIMMQLKEQHQKHVEEIVMQLREHYQKEVKELKMYNEKLTDLCRLKPSGDIVLKMPSFHRHKEASQPWYSPGFYTHSHGYKMCLNVDANGSKEGQGSHVSVYLYLMKGEYDDDLIWPLRYSCTVTLLNQLMDGYHQAKTLTYSKDEKDRFNNRVHSAKKGATSRSDSAQGYPKFIAHDLLDLNEVGCQYLTEDCLYFRVQVKVLSPPKPWLVPTVLQ